MEDQPHLLLFGDQTVETLSSIQNLFRQSRTSTSLSRFLREATDVIQIQASKLNATEQKRFFGFETILDLAESYESQQDPDDLVATVLMCISQLGELIM
jgi:Starter unit:ACP transacylase in aflatoxin biosynthesis